MSTQNEFEDWRDRHDHLTKAAFEDAYSLGSAPLLSRIAELESRIDALSKDAEVKQ